MLFWLSFSYVIPFVCGNRTEPYQLLLSWGLLYRARSSREQKREPCWNHVTTPVIEMMEGCFGFGGFLFTVMSYILQNSCGAHPFVTSRTQWVTKMSFSFNFDSKLYQNKRFGSSRNITVPPLLHASSFLRHSTCWGCHSGGSSMPRPFPQKSELQYHTSGTIPIHTTTGNIKHNKESITTYLLVPFLCMCCGGRQYKSVQNICLSSMYIFSVHGISSKGD